MNFVKSTLFGLLLTMLILAACAPSPQTDLTGSEWKLTSLQVNGENMELKTQNPVTLEIDKDHAVAGSAGCNHYFGAIDFKSDGSLEASNFGNTEMFCMEGMEVETAFLSAMISAETWSLNGDTLTIKSPEVESVLVFTK